MKRSKSYTWLSGLLGMKPEGPREDWGPDKGGPAEEWGPAPPDAPLDDEWGPAPWVRADLNQPERAVFWGRCYCNMLRWVVLVMAAAGVGRVRGDAEVMSHVTAHFGKALEECRDESGLTPEIMEEFKHFWSEDFEVVHRELGCAIICMSKKFALLQDDTRIHHVNMDDYIKSFPNGEILSSKMVEMIHNCEKQYDDMTDECDRVVKVSACFKQAAKKGGIAPEVAMIEAVMEKY